MVLDSKISYCILTGADLNKITVNFISQQMINSEERVCACMLLYVWFMCTMPGV